MNVEGLTPGKGTPADRLGGAKRPPAASGKSFSDALKKAAGAAPQGAPPSRAVPAPMPAPEPVASPLAQPTEDHIAAIKYRLQTGYYNNPKIDDALSDKLSGYFDGIA